MLEKDKGQGGLTKGSPNIEREDSQLLCRFFWPTHIAGARSCCRAYVHTNQHLMQPSAIRAVIVREGAVRLTLRNAFQLQSGSSCIVAERSSSGSGACTPSGTRCLPVCSLSMHTRSAKEPSLCYGERIHA